jgi:hypothetical protein
LKAPTRAAGKVVRLFDCPRRVLADWAEMKLHRAVLLPQLKLNSGGTYVSRNSGELELSFGLRILMGERPIVARPVRVQLLPEAARGPRVLLNTFWADTRVVRGRTANAAIVGSIPTRP